MQKIIKLLFCFFIIIAIGCNFGYVRPIPESTPKERMKQLYYLIGTNGVKELLKMGEYDRQYYQMALDTFWHYHDPTPLTEENELRQLYYSRIDYCLTWFNRCTVKGWRTDRGKCLMILGFPDDVYDEPIFEYWHTGIQIWEYWAKHYELIFVERYAGCYWLTNPPHELTGW